MGNTHSHQGTYRVTSSPRQVVSHPLIMECRQGSYEAVKAILDTRDDCKAYLTQSIVKACLKGNLEVTKLLIERGANVNGNTDESWSPLMIASQNGHSTIVELLLHQSAQVNTQNFYGTSSLMLAAQEGHKQVAELLIQHGAEVNMTNNEGISCLMNASGNGHESIVKMLIEKGALVNLKGKNGETALMTACAHGHCNVVHLLVENNADVHYTYKGESALDIIKKKNNENQNIERILMRGKTYGASIATVDQIAADIGMNPQLLDRPFSEELLLRIAQLIPNWLEYAEPMKLTQQEINGINTDPQLNFQMKTRKLLRVWYSKSAHTQWAHYRALVEVSCDLGLADVAGKICAIVKENSVLPEDNPNVTHISRELKLFNTQCVGGGAFGTVFKGELNGQPCALKVLHALASEIHTSLPTTVVANSDSVERFRQECEYLKSFKHPNIVQQLATKTHPKSGYLVLVLELMDCNLRQYISHQASKIEQATKGLCKDIVSAIEYIHFRKIIHRDLCGDNILLDSSQEPPVAKVCDFGMSRIISTEGTSISLPAFWHRGYLPPEALVADSSNFDSSFDIFQFGAVMLQIVQYLPTIKSQQQRCTELDKVDSTHPFKSLIEQCFREDRSSRPTASELKHQITHSVFV